MSDTVVSISKPAAYRQMLRIAFVQVHQRIARTARQLNLPDAAERRAAAEALPRHVNELALFVQALSRSPAPAEPLVAVELIDCYCIALQETERRLTAGESAPACQLAQRVVDLITVEMSWMPQP